MSFPSIRIAGLTVVLGAFACAAPTSSSAPPPNASAKQKLPAPAHLPAVARALLAERMMSHGRDLSDLVWAMLFLDSGSVREIGDAIASEPRIARPVSGDATELASQLPEAFFVFQDRLAENAGALARAAESNDVEEMAISYGELTATCVRCHAAYLTDAPLRAWPEDETDE